MNFTEAIKEYRKGKTIRRDSWPKDIKMNFITGEHKNLEVEDTYAYDWVVIEEGSQTDIREKTITLDYRKSKFNPNNVRQYRDIVLALGDLLGGLKSNEHVSKIDIKIQTIKKEEN